MSPCCRATLSDQVTHAPYVASGQTAQTTIPEPSVSLLVKQVLKILRVSLCVEASLTKPSFLVASSYVFLMPRLSTALSRDRPSSHSMEK